MPILAMHLKSQLVMRFRLLTIVFVMIGFIANAQTAEQETAINYNRKCCRKPSRRLRYDRIS